MASFAHQPPHLPVDLGCREPLGHETARQMTLAGGLGGVVALVGDGDDVLSEAEGE